MEATLYHQVALRTYFGRGHGFKVEYLRYACGVCGRNVSKDDSQCPNPFCGNVMVSTIEKHEKL